MSYFNFERSTLIVLLSVACGFPSRDAPEEWRPYREVYVRAPMPHSVGVGFAEVFPPPIIPVALVSVPLHPRVGGYQLLYPGAFEPEQVIKHYASIRLPSNAHAGVPRCDESQCELFFSQMLASDYMVGVTVHARRHRNYTYVSVSNYDLTDSGHAGFLKFCDGLDGLLGSL